MQHRKLAQRSALLMELSTLRDQYTKLTGDCPPHWNIRANGAKKNPTDEAVAILHSVDNSEILGQSDRDAIEAFFNSEDNFTAQFNSEKCSVKRADIIKKTRPLRYV